MMDYVTIGQGRLTNQFSEKPLIRALVGAMLSPLTDHESVADQLKNERWISTIPLGESSVTLESGLYPGYGAKDLLSFSRSSKATRTNEIGLLEYVNNDVARIEYNHVGLTRKGLLIEDAATNLLTHSEQFDNAVWVKNGVVTVTPNAITAPNGTVTAGRIASSVQGDGVYETILSGGTAPVTASIYLKAGSHSTLLLMIAWFNGGAYQNISVQVFLDTGTLSGISSGAGGVGLGSSISAVGGGWYRVSLSGVGTDAANTQVAIQTYKLGNTPEDYYAWGAQLEAGSFPTSYIATTTSAATRAADIAKTMPVFNVQLDGCGYIVGEKRQGRSDESYRKAILFRVFVNTSNATPEDLIHGLRYLTSPDDIQYIEQYPATAMLFTDGPNVQDDIQTVMQDLAPAAISQLPIMVSFSHAKPFRFNKEPDNRLLNVGEGTRLTANGNRISISPSEETDNGPRLGGISPAFMTANGSKLKAGLGRLRINSPNHQTIIESGYHLTGCY